MLLHSSLVFGFLFVSVALADGRRERQSSFLDRIEQSTNAASNGVRYSSNWAGAVWEKEDGTFTHVTGTFKVPYAVSGENDAGASAWVGIDGDTCTSGLIQAGIDFTIKDKKVSYDAWYEWFPDNAYYFPENLRISPGNIIKASVTVWGSTSGKVTIENISEGQSATVTLESIFPLCGQNAEWIVEDFSDGGGLVPFADFGEVIFWDAKATGEGTYTPQGATLFDIEQNHKVKTSAWISDSSVGVKYV